MSTDQREYIHAAAIGVEFGSRIVEIKEGDDAGKRIKLQIWDTAGQVRVATVGGGLGLLSRRGGVWGRTERERE